MKLLLPTFEDACQVLGIKPGDVAGLSGRGWWELRGDDGELRELGVFSNLITDIGDQYYMERAAGIGSPPAQVTGMQYGTGVTAPSKTGAGAAVVTYVSGSNQAIDGGFPTSSQPGGAGTARRIQWKVTYAAGTGTANAIAEAVIVNQTIATNSGAPAANTISRALISPTVNKAAADSLAITWNHDGLGA